MAPVAAGGARGAPCLPRRAADRRAAARNGPASTNAATDAILAVQRRDSAVKQLTKLAATPQIDARSWGLRYIRTSITIRNTSRLLNCLEAAP